MALSALGVEIGPLISAAGAVASPLASALDTLVEGCDQRMFYLLDDAFRVGEYIESWDYKGTAGSFSLVGPVSPPTRAADTCRSTSSARLYMSRDWVIEKLKVGVTYDDRSRQGEDADQQIGKELAQIPSSRRTSSNL